MGKLPKIKEHTGSSLIIIHANVVAFNNFKTMHAKKHNFKPCDLLILASAMIPALRRRAGG
jgi:hypothetical protein